MLVNFFTNNHLEYYEITYEKLVDSFNDEITKIINYIGVNFKEDSTSINIPTQRQSNAINSRFKAYYKIFPKSLLAAIYRVYSSIFYKHVKSLSTGQKRKRELKIREREK